MAEDVKRDEKGRILPGSKLAKRSPEFKTARQLLQIELERMAVAMASDPKEFFSKEDETVMEKMLKHHFRKNNLYAMDSLLDRIVGKPKVQQDDNDGKTNEIKIDSDDLKL